jgi:lipopolysaccharide transport system permease protein
MKFESPIPVEVYEPPQGWFPGMRWRELWEYRELLYFLTLRDIQVRYKQAALGVTWVVIQPLLTMVIFSVIFGRLAKLPSEGIPYPIFSYVALLPWLFFAGSLSRAGNSLVANSNLLTKIYFPRLVIPLSAVGTGLVDFVVSFVVLLGLIIFYHISPTWAVLTLPLFILLAGLTALAVGLWLSALNVQYRDVQHLIPFIITAWMYASPVAYSASLIPTGFWKVIYGLNPMAGVIQGFRWALLGAEPPGVLFLVSVVVVIVLLVTGLMYFRKMEDGFADVV